MVLCEKKAQSENENGLRVSNYKNLLKSQCEKCWGKTENFARKSFGDFRMDVVVATGENFQFSQFSLVFVSCSCMLGKMNAGIAVNLKFFDCWEWGERMVNILRRLEVPRVVTNLINFLFSVNCGDEIFCDTFHRVSEQMFWWTLWF